MIMDWRGRRVAIVGLGVSNTALCRFLLSKGARVTVLDKKGASEMEDALRALDPGIPGHFGPGYLDGLKGHDMIFLTPGMPKDLPQIEEARERSAEVSSETQLFLENCAAKVIGITGSAGKTTTTTLVGEILKRWGVQVFVGGNIGRPLIEEVEAIPSEAYVVMELSSFQLELVKSSPHVAALLNLSPDHLNIHGSLERYFEAKKGIFCFQGDLDCSVFNGDRENTVAMSKEAPGRVAFFSTLSPVELGAYASEGTVYLSLEGPKAVCSVEVLGVKGHHNLENALAALACAGLAGAPPEAAAVAFRGFRGVEHRIEMVREVGGVKYYNDSIATAPDRCLAALNTLEPPLIMIAGGYDKGVPFDGLATAMMGRVRVLITLGKAAGRIELAVARASEGRDDAPEIVRCRDLTDAVDVAKRVSRAGESVVLSPACASYDMFRNFEERGRFFKALVGEIGE